MQRWVRWRAATFRTAAGRQGSGVPVYPKAYAGAEVGAAAGSDVSHRGGPPGFVALAGDRRALRWADYTGNDMFNTLGNLLANGDASLLFIDYATGDTLRLNGRASIDLDDRSLPGAQRVLAFAIERWAHARAALPLAAAGPPEYSPYNPRGGAGGAPARYARLVAAADAAAGIKTFTFAWPEVPTRQRPSWPPALTETRHQCQKVGPYQAGAQHTPS